MELILYNIPKLLQIIMMNIFKNLHSIEETPIYVKIT